MQIDFHHTTTYTLSRLAGFPHQAARIIAYAAQYVDDAKNQGLIRFTNNQAYEHIASAHTVVPTSVTEAKAFRENLDNTLNAEAWLPFHFLPGNLGKPAGVGGEAEMVRRLVCTTDSPVASEMWRACIANRNQPNGLHRLGITTHVYADTWAHNDFVGLDHPFNRIQRLLHDEPGMNALGEDFQSRLAGAFPIGHGMVLTLPDQPFLSWGYVDRDGNPKRRNNTQMFLEASERIVAFHGLYLEMPGGAQIEGKDKDILLQAFSGFTAEDGDARHEGWMGLLGKGRFSFGALSPTELGELNYIPKGRGSWKYDALGTEAAQDDPSETYEWTPAFESSHWKHFHDALKAHRSEVLDRILPVFQLNPTC